MHHCSQELEVFDPGGFSPGWGSEGVCGRNNFNGKSLRMTRPATGTGKAVVFHPRLDLTVLCRRGGTHGLFDAEGPFVSAPLSSSCQYSFVFRQISDVKCGNLTAPAWWSWTRWNIIAWQLLCRVIFSCSLAEGLGCFPFFFVDTPGPDLPRISRNEAMPCGRCWWLATRPG